MKIGLCEIEKYFVVIYNFFGKSEKNTTLVHDLTYEN